MWRPFLALVLAGACWGADLVREFAGERVFWKQIEVAQRMVAAGDRTVLGALEAWLSRDDRHARGNAALVFAAMGDERGWTVITGMLTDRAARGEGQGVPNAPWTEKAQVSADRYYAVHLLGCLKSPRGVAVLAPLLGDAELNFKVPWSLGQIGGPEATRVLLRALRHENVDVRVVAIGAVQEAGMREALPVLRGMVGDGERNHFGQPTTVGAAARVAIGVLERAR